MPAFLLKLFGFYEVHETCISLGSLYDIRPCEVEKLSINGI
jgi:hypothetical protein